MWGTWVWHLARGELRQCIDLAQETMAWAEAGHVRGIRSEAHHLPAATMHYRGHFAPARGHSAQAVALGDDLERCRIWSGFTGQYSAVANRCYLFLPLWHLGFPDQALRLSEESVALARTIAHPYSLAYALHHMGWLYLQGRLGAKLSAAAQEQLAISAEQGFALWHATGTFFQGAGMLLQGKPQEAIPLLLKGLQAFRAGGMGLWLTCQYSTLADAYMQAGRWEDSRQALDEALIHAEKNDERCHEAELHRQRGELFLAESPHRAAAAEDCFRQAIETARGQQSRAWELRATMSLARLWQRQGRRDDARAALAAVYDTYTEGFTTPDLIDAATLLEAPA
jgi:predicted ATPase